MNIVNPYLNFAGKTEEAFNFYKSVFGGEFSRVSRFSDIPEQNGPDDVKDQITHKIPEDVKNQIMHIALPLGKNNFLMGSDAPESMGFKVSVGNNIHISIHAESREEADKLFNGLSEGGKVEMAMQDMFWGDYFGNFSDKYGVNWMISFTQQ